MDNWSEIQKISTDSRAGTKQLSTSQASQFLKLVSLVDLFKLMTKAVVEGPSITASTISSALLAITTSPPVLDSPSLLDALQRHQLEALSPTSHPRVSRAVLEHVREFVECSHVSTERKLAFFMGHGAPMIAFPTAILRSVVHEDVDVYTAAAKAVKAVMTLDDGSLSTSQEKIFKGVFVLIMRSLGSSGLLKMPPAFGDAMLQLRCVGLAAAIAAQSTHLLSRTRALPTDVMDIAKYFILLVGIDDFLVQAAALEVLAETISLRHGHALLLDTSEPGRAELWECIRKLCIAARGVPHSVRFAACSIFGHFLQAKSDSTGNRSMDEFVASIMGTSEMDPNEPSAYDVSSSDCREALVGALFGCIHTFVRHNKTEALDYFLKHSQIESSTATKKFLSSWRFCTCGHYASTELQGFALQALTACVRVAVDDGSASAAKKIALFLDSCFVPHNGQTLVAQLVQKVTSELDNDFRNVVLEFLKWTCMVQAGGMSWGPRQVLGSKIALDYLGDAQSENSKSGREQKFAWLDAFIKHPSVGDGQTATILSTQSSLKNLRKMHAAGPYPAFDSVATVATKSSQ